MTKQVQRLTKKRLLKKFRLIIRYTNTRDGHDPTYVNKK